MVVVSWSLPGMALKAANESKSGLIAVRAAGLSIRAENRVSKYLASSNGPGPTPSLEGTTQFSALSEKKGAKFVWLK